MSWDFETNSAGVHLIKNQADCSWDSHCHHELDAVRYGRCVHCLTGRPTLAGQHWHKIIFKIKSLLFRESIGFLGDGGLNSQNRILKIKHFFTLKKLYKVILMSVLCMN